MYQSSYKREQLSGFVFNMQVSIFNWKPVLPDFTTSASSETQGLWVDFKSGRKSPWGHCLTFSSISLTLCAETETFHLEQSFVARRKQTRRATELLVHLRVKTHERTLKHTSLWLGRKTQRFSGTNQMPERLRPFGTSLVRQCPQGLFRPDLKSTHSPWVSEDAMSVNLVQFIRFVNVFWPPAKCHKESKYHSNKIVLSMDKKVAKKDSLGAKVDYF